MNILRYLWLATLALTAVLGLPVTEMPYVVRHGEEGVQHLWLEIQNGKLHKVVPQRYAYTSGASDHYLDSYGRFLLKETPRVSFHFCIKR